MGKAADSSPSKENEDTSEKVVKVLEPSQKEASEVTHTYVTSCAHHDSQCILLSDIVRPQAFPKEAPTMWIGLTDMVFRPPSSPALRKACKAIILMISVICDFPF